MAPESERAKMCGMLATVNGVKMVCSQLEGHGNFHTLAPEQPNEPTLTCSEVVERLAKCYQPFAEAHGHSGTFGMRFDREQATAILHSWRERRVQELEECLRKYGRHLVTCPHLSENMRSNSDCNCGWDEWREQIRKGAKHD